MAKRDKPCLVCGATEGPMCNGDEPCCCEDHRKALLAMPVEVPTEDLWTGVGRAGGW